MTTPQGTGEPTNLCPDTEMEPMGLRKVTMGARFTKGICGMRAAGAAAQVRATLALARTVGLLPLRKLMRL